MNDLEFAFEQSPWELAAETLRSGDTLDAGRFLALLDGEEEQAAEDALQWLTEEGITLTVESLAKDYGSGKLEQRLRLEEKLVQENRLPQGLDAGDPLRIYLEELASTPAAGDPQFLADRYLSGEEAVAGMLVNVTMSLVLEEAKKHTGRGVLLLDLIQEGSLGLWQGILEWRGEGDFLSHSRWWIRQAMAKVITLQARANGTGQKLRKLLEDYRAADRRLLTRLGRNPVAEEIAQELKISMEDALTAQQMMQTAQLMEQVRKASQPKEETPEDDQPVEDTAYFQSRQRVMELLSALDEQDARILTLRFGLEGGLPMSPQDVGKKLNITAEDVVRREAAALAKLRNHE